MRSRRRDTRFRLTEPANGTVRVFPDVIVQQNGEDEWIAISREASAAGDIVTLDPDVGELRQRHSVWVIDSRPVIIDGDCDTALRLQAGAQCERRRG